MLNLNPDIFLTINRIMRDAAQFKAGKLQKKSPILLNELQRVIDGSSEVPFLPSFKGTLTRVLPREL